MGVGFPTRLGPFYSQDGSGGASIHVKGQIEIGGRVSIPGSYNPNHWIPAFGEIATTTNLETGQPVLTTNLNVPQGLDGLPGVFHGGFRALAGTVFVSNVANQLDIDPKGLLRSTHTFHPGGLNSGSFTIRIEKNRLGNPLVVITDSNGSPIYTGLFFKEPPPERGTIFPISDYTPTGSFGCIGSCAVGSPYPSAGLGFDYTYNKITKAMMAALPPGVTSKASRLAFVLAGSDDLAWLCGFFSSGGHAGITNGIELKILNQTLLDNADLLVHVSADTPTETHVPIRARVVTSRGFVAAELSFKYVRESDPLADGSITRRLGTQITEDIRNGRHSRNLDAYYDLLGHNDFHAFMERARVPNDLLPQNLRRHTGYRASCFGVAGLSDVGSRVLQSPFFQTENPYRSLSRSADRFASGVFGGVRSTLGMGLYDLLSGKSFSLEQLLTNSLGMLSVGALASSVINPSGFFGFTGHSLLTIGFNHLLSGDFSFSKEEVMTTLVSTLVGGAIEAGAMSGALKALGFAGKTFGRILRSQATLGQAVETTLTHLTLGSLLSTLGLVSSEATNQAMASFLGIEKPQPNMIA